MAKKLLVVDESEILKCKAELSSNPDGAMYRLRCMQDWDLLKQAPHPWLLKGFRNEPPPNDSNFKVWHDFGRLIRAAIDGNSCSSP